MSEQRLASSGDSFVDLTEMQIVDLLNELSDENAKLKRKVGEQQDTIQELERKVKKYAKIGEEQLKQIIELQEENEKLQKENEQLRRLFEEMKQPITINLTEEDEKELRKLLGLIDDE